MGMGVQACAGVREQLHVPEHSRRQGLNSQATTCTWKPDPHEAYTGRRGRLGGKDGVVGSQVGLIQCGLCPCKRRSEHRHAQRTTT